MCHGSRQKVLLLVDFEVFASRVRPACSLQDTAIIKDRVIACEGVNLQDTTELAQVLPGMFAPAVFRILKPYCGVCAVAPAAVIAHIRPDPPKVGLALASAQRSCGRVIAVDLVRLQRITTNRQG